MAFIRSFLIVFALVAVCSGLARASEPLLLQSPTVSRTQIAFVYGGDLWVVGRGGGTAHRLIAGVGLASAPFFSPDGSMLAFSANNDGNTNAYVVPAGGGEPKRLTFAPSCDIVTGWTNDGSRVVFRSGRNSGTDAAQLYTISASGGLATMLPLPDAQGGSYSSDGARFAYVPNSQWEPYWRGYRGGQVTPIWIANLSDSSVDRIVTGSDNNRNPMWIGNRIYYLSDRDGSFTLYAYDLQDPRLDAVGRESSRAGHRFGLGQRRRNRLLTDRLDPSLRPRDANRSARFDIARRGYAAGPPTLDSRRG